MEVKSPEVESEYIPEIRDDGTLKLKKREKVVQGAKSKKSGASFESRVRLDLEGKGWIVDKWSNNVDLDRGKVIPARTEWKYNPFRKVMMPQAQGTGFPDFVAFQHLDGASYSVIGVEVKVNGYLSKDEKFRCKWLLDNHIFSQILVARKVKVKNRVGVEYVDVNEILNRMR